MGRRWRAAPTKKKNKPGRTHLEKAASDLNHLRGLPRQQSRRGRRHAACGEAALRRTYRRRSCRHSLPQREPSPAENKAHVVDPANGRAAVEPGGELGEPRSLVRQARLLALNLEERQGFYFVEACPHAGFSPGQDLDRTPLCGRCEMSPTRLEAKMALSQDISHPYCCVRSC